MRSNLLIIFAIISLFGFAKVNPKVPIIAGGVNDSITAEQAFDKYITLLGEYRTHISIPDGYAPIKAMHNHVIPYRFSYPDNDVRLFYNLGLKSSTNGVLFLYPIVPFDFGNFTIRQGDEIQRELRSVYKDKLLDVNDLVDIADVKGKEGYANADTIAIYEFDIKTAASPYSDEYSKCIGVYLRSKYHPCLLLKILLSEKEYANKDKYIRLLLENIKYDESSPMLFMLEEDLDRIFSDLKFETKDNNPELHRLKDILKE